MEGYKMTETQKESAINGYLMSLAVFATTMPIPIINLFANIIYYLRRRKSQYISRWHSMNAFVSQLPLFFINSFTWYSVWRIAWGEWTLNNYLVAYYILAATLNIAEIVLSVICCIKVKNGKDVDWVIISPLCHIFCGKKSWDVWTMSWVPAEPVFFELAEKAKKQIVNHTLYLVGGLLVAFFCISKVLLSSENEYPRISMFDYIEEAVYNSQVNGHEVNDPKASKYLTDCVDHLRKANGIDSVTVYLVKSREVNAFAYCGRNLVVYTKLVETCDTENELLSVIGHELGHIEKEHVTKSVKKNMGIQILFAALGNNLSSLASDLTTNHLSRKCERQADALSVQYLYNADIDPSGFATFMKKILTGTFADNISFISNHPATQERIDESLERVAKLAPKEYKTVLTEEEWTEFKDLAANAGTKPYSPKKRSWDFDDDEEDEEEEGDVEE